MTWNAFWLILQRHIQGHLVRVLIASAGIMIGIWSIVLTSSLSFGLSSKIIDAINSQPSSREFSVNKTPTGAKSFFEISSAPVFEAITSSELANIARNEDYIESITPVSFAGMYFNTEPQVVDSCSGLASSIRQTPTNLPDDPTPQLETTPSLELDLVEQQLAKCREIHFRAGDLSQIAGDNQATWYGRKDDLKPGEVAICYSCFGRDKPLSEYLKATSPQDLIGKKIQLEYNHTPNLYTQGEVLDFTKFTDKQQYAEEKIVNSYTIAAVWDDSNNEASSFGASTPSFYVSESEISKILAELSPEITLAELAYTEFTIRVKDFQDLEQGVSLFREKGFLADSATIYLIAGIQSLALGVTLILGLFGLIALIASVFGIVNVMVISVLRRKKEIGILKSLGARSRSVFFLFLTESALLGLIGWLLGTFLAWLSLLGIGFAAERYLATNSEAAANLARLNIDNFYFQPSFPILLIALVLALLFTTLSGLIPAIRASRQNPVEVLRSE